MSKITLYDNDFATMWYLPETKIVHHHLHKFMFGEEFHKFLLAGTAAIKKYHAQKWLSDDRNNSVLKKEDMEWGMVNWLPQTVQGGWKYWAIVQPEKVIAQMNMEQLAKEYAKLGLVTRFFSDPDAALKWLESV